MRKLVKSLRFLGLPALLLALALILPDVTVVAAKENPTPIIRFDANVTINTSTMRETGTQSVTESYSGGNIATIWPELRIMGISAGYTVNDSSHSMTHSETVDVPFSMDDYAGTQINQNGNKVRVPISEVGLPFDDYLIMTKR